MTKEVNFFVCDRPTPTCAERCGTSRQRHAQVWPWTVADSPCWLALARCGRSSSVQASRHSSPVSTQQSTALEVYLYTTMRYINWHFTYLLTNMSTWPTGTFFIWVFLGFLLKKSGLILKSPVATLFTVAIFVDVLCEFFLSGYGIWHDNHVFWS